MGKHEKNRNHNDPNKVIIMITAIIGLVKVILEIIKILLS